MQWILQELEDTEKLAEALDRLVFLTRGIRLSRSLESLCPSPKCGTRCPL